MNSADPVVGMILRRMAQRSCSGNTIVWRAPVDDGQIGTVTPAPATTSTAAFPSPGTVVFCLHIHTTTSVAGLFCSECGTVVAPVVDGAPGLTRPPIIPTPPVDIIGGAQGAADNPGARLEWDKHVHGVSDQPAEVMQHAWVIFQRVYALRGAVGGNKARPGGGRGTGRPPVSGRLCWSVCCTPTACCMGRTSATRSI